MDSPGQAEAAAPPRSAVQSIWGVLLAPEKTFRALAARPQWLAALILLVVALVYHSSLGTQVVAEDYVHASGRRAIVLIVLRLLHVGLAAAGIFAVFLIATRAPL